jgi:Flp pilus assembly pilin Flp
MNAMKKSRHRIGARTRKFWHDEQGATAIEYGLFVAIVVALGDKINTDFTNVNSKFP